MAEAEEYTSKIASLLTCLCAGGDSGGLDLDGWRKTKRVWGEEVHTHLKKS